MAKKKTTKKRAKRAASRSTSRKLDNVSLDDLQREMRRRQREVGKLAKKRDRLAGELEALDKEIASLGGSFSGGGYGTTTTGKVRRRPRNEASLGESLLGVLKNKTMSVTEAAEAVQRAGYKTTSSSFRTIVNQTLIKDPRFKKVSRGKYTAK